MINTRVYNEVDLIIPVSSVNSTNLEKELLFNDKSIKVTSTNKFKDKGFLRIQNEIVHYEKKTGKSFDIIKRSLFNSQKKLKYNIETIITQKDIGIWSEVINKLKKLPFVIEVKIISISSSRGRILVKFMGNKKTFFQAANEIKLNFKDLNSQQYLISN